MESIVDTGIKVRRLPVKAGCMMGEFRGDATLVASPKLWGYMAGYGHDILNKADLIKLCLKKTTCKVGGGSLVLPKVLGTKISLPWGGWVCAVKMSFFQKFLFETCVFCVCECLCHLFQKDHQKASRRIATLLGTNQKDTGMSMVLSRWIITPIEVGWIRPVNRWNKINQLTITIVASITSGRTPSSWQLVAPGGFPNASGHSAMGSTKKEFRFLWSPPCQNKRATFSFTLYVGKLIWPMAKL